MTTHISRHRIAGDTVPLGGMHQVVYHVSGALNEHWRPQPPLSAATSR